MNAPQYALFGLPLTYLDEEIFDPFFQIRPPKRFTKENDCEDRLQMRRSRWSSALEDIEQLVDECIGRVNKI